MRGIAALTRGPYFHGKCSETTQLDAVAVGQRLNDLFQDGRDDALDVAMVEMRVSLRQARDQFRFDHPPAPKGNSPETDEAAPTTLICQSGFGPSTGSH